MVSARGHPGNLLIAVNRRVMRPRAATLPRRRPSAASGNETGRPELLVISTRARPAARPSQSSTRGRRWRQRCRGPGRLLNRQPAEVAEFDDASLARAESRHAFERLVQRQHVDVSGAVGCDVLSQRDACELAATLVGPTRPRQVDEDPSHDTGRRPEEVSPTQPPGLSLIDDSDVGLVHEGRSLQRLTRRFATEVCCRQASEVVVEEGYELVERFSPAVARGDEQLHHSRGLGRALIHRVGTRIGENGAHCKEEETI